MSRRKIDPLEYPRQELERAWEEWDKRPSPAHSMHMLRFYEWVQSNRRDLLDYRDQPRGDEQW